MGWGALAILVVATGVYVAMRSPTTRTDPQLVAKVRRLQEPLEQQVIYVPIAANPSAQPDVAAAAAPEQPAPAEDEQPVAADPQPGRAVTLPAPAAPGPPVNVPVVVPTPQDEVGTMRRLGGQEFEREMQTLSRKADAADVAWERFLSGCRLNVTSVVAVAGVADRDWIAVAGVSVVEKQWTEACSEAGTFFALANQVHDGVCVAMDRARRSWVYPGTTRELRHKYRLDWEGWDTACH
jgi:hypothetical protein